MAEVPAITLTDPNNHDQAPSPARSPEKSNINYGALGSKVVEPARPGTPNNNSKNGHARTNSGGWSSPGRLIRTLSHNAQTVAGASKHESNGEQETSTAIDPLSKHILKRTHTPLSLPTTGPSRPRSPDGADSSQKDGNPLPVRERTSTPSTQPSVTRTNTSDSTTPAHRDLKKGVKAVSFLSRLMGGAKKKEGDEEGDEDESNASEGRPEGHDAEVYNMGYNPRHPQPPAYIKVRAKNKRDKDFDRLFLAQELQSSGRPPLERRGSSNKLRRKSSATPSDDRTIWAMEFSRDGKYFAAAGADMIVRVWAVLSSADDRRKHEWQESTEGAAGDADGDAQHLSAPVFLRTPVREYEGHTSTILDLSWSKNNFLLSSSMDKTVRLWHVTRAECLCTFKHNDFVPSIAFHPKDDRFFLAGSLDSKLRLWSIPDKSVAYAAQMPDLITAVAFTPDGKFAMAGSLGGLCMFYETEGLKYQTQIHVRSTRGQNAKGSKITGIQTQYGSSGEVKVLITSNDSRIRLYNFRDKSLELKFRGNENNCSQIRACVSDDGRYVACGSEDRKAYIWSLHQSHGEKRDKTPVEMFEAHNTIATAVCIAPGKTRQHLSRAEDPVYDLCNPPPVTLLSRAERAESHDSSRPPTENGSNQASPRQDEAKFEKPKEPASYVTRSSHKEGNIIVTADFGGKIKVFRQDCAWQKRIKDDWDKSSLFAKRSGRLSRTGSVQTRASQKSIRDGSRASTSTQAPSDRILSWRQGIASTPSVVDGKTDSSKATSRSTSPRRSLDQRGRREAKPGSTKPPHPLAADALAQTTSPTRRESKSGNASPKASPRLDDPIELEEDNPLSLQGGRSDLFWNRNMWQRQAERIHKMAEAHDSEYQTMKPARGQDSAGDGIHLAVRPPLHQTPTYVSELSDEHSSEEFDDAREHSQEEMECSKCGNDSFAARKDDHGSPKLVCTMCRAAT